MKALLVQPEFPTTYWGFQRSLWLAGRRASLPPLGLLSIAALLPRDWQLRLVDMNVEKLDDADLRWADVVLTGGMRVQAPSIHDVVRRAHAMARRVVVGGPAPTTSPEEYDDADLVFIGEAEGRAGELIAMLAEKSPDRNEMLRPPEGPRPPMSTVPVPRYDLLRPSLYTSMSIQYSRGCPFTCEFCDIVAMFGNVPRVKSETQILAELDAIAATGFRGSVFFVDDNFIGNARAVKKLLPEIERWQAARGYPYELFTEASVNLAADEELTAAMVRAGFASVFLGIETPNAEALRETNKKQNLRLDLNEAVSTLTRAGIEVMGGFIVGFDCDKPEAFEAQHSFISSAPLPLAMVGLLIALPGTELESRLAAEGRMRETSDGDAFGRPNFETAMDEQELLAGYARLLERLYTPAAYYQRCLAYVEQSASIPGRRKASLADWITCAKVVLMVGVLAPWRRHFWRLVWGAARRGASHFPWAIAHAIMGEHMIRYTREDVLPRVRAALEEVNAKAALAPVEPEVASAQR